MRRTRQCPCPLPTFARPPWPQARQPWAELHRQDIDFPAIACSVTPIFLAVERIIPQRLGRGRGSRHGENNGHASIQGKNAIREPSQRAWRKVAGEHTLPLLARNIPVYVRQCSSGHLHSTPCKLGNGSVDRFALSVGVMVDIAQTSASDRVRSRTAQRSSAGCIPTDLLTPTLHIRGPRTALGAKSTPCDAFPGTKKPPPCSIASGLRVNRRVRMIQSPFVRTLLSSRPSWVISVGSGLTITPGDGAQDPETQADHHNTSHHRSCSFHRGRTRSSKSPLPLEENKHHTRQS
jgi:hypothetical protein